MPNPHLKRMSPQELPEAMRAAHARSMSLRGDATFFEIFGNHPELYRWYTENFYGQVFHGGLVGRRIMELVRLRLSTTHGCRFCNQGNCVDALEAGRTDVELAGLDDYENASFTAAEKAALRLADQMVLTKSDGTLTRHLYQEVSQHFSDAQILELGLVMGILSGVAKFMFAFDLVEREDTCPIPHQLD